MRRFKNPELQVAFTFPKPMANGAVDEVNGSRYSVHKFLCTSNPHANSIIERILDQNDPFQKAVHVPINKVRDRLCLSFT